LLNPQVLTFPRSRMSPLTQLRWVTAALGLGALFVLWPLWPALLLAAWTAALSRPLLERFERCLRGRRRAAGALSLLLFVLLASPLVLMGAGVLSGAQELVELVRSSASAKSALETLASSPDSQLHLPDSFADVVALAERSGTQGLKLVGDVFGAAARVVVGVFLFFGGAYTFLVDGPALWTWLKRHSPLEERHLERLAAAFHETGRGLIVGVGFTSLAQGLVATGIYFALGVPRAWVLGPITGIASIIPLLGTSLVWGPIALGLLLTGQVVKGVILIAFGVGVIAVIDNLLRPVFARLGALHLPMFLLFLSAFGGLVTFGPWGALVGPLVVRLAIEALRLVEEERTDTPR
jgi:predicted PurR-regulated permease PerM